MKMKRKSNDTRKKIGAVELEEVEVFIYVTKIALRKCKRGMTNLHDLYPDGTLIMVGKNVMPIPIKGYSMGTQRVLWKGVPDYVQDSNRTQKWVRHQSHINPRLSVSLEGL